MKKLLFIISLGFLNFAWARNVQIQEEPEWVTCKQETSCIEINLSYIVKAEHDSNYSTEEPQIATFRSFNGTIFSCEVFTIKKGRHCFTKERLESF